MELGRKLGGTLSVVEFIFPKGLDEGLLVEVGDQIAIVRLVGIKDHRGGRLGDP